MNERIKRIIALEKVMAKTKPLSVEASTKEIAEALIMLYDDPAARQISPIWFPAVAILRQYTS